MTTSWDTDAARFLLDRSRCPRCGSAAIDERGVCRSCRAVLNGPVAQQLLQTSVAAAELLERRSWLIAQLPTEPAPALATASTSAVAAAPGDGAPMPSGRGQVSLQSVLAVVGASLFAIAAIVFAFFNRDLTDDVTRRVVLAATTVLFMGAAALLGRRGVRLSAEAIGALGMVFLAIDIWLGSEAAAPALSPWTAGAIGTGAAAAGLLLLGRLLALRVWLFTGTVALVLVPAMLGYGASGAWSTAIGHLGAAAVALAVHPLLRRLGASLGASFGASAGGSAGAALRVEHATATLLRMLASALVLLNLLWLDGADGWMRSVGSFVVLAVLAVIAGLGVREWLGGLWRVAAGVFAALSTTVLVTAPFAVQPLSDTMFWLLAVLPAGALAGVATVVLPRWPRALAAAGLWAGALSVALALLVPLTLAGGVEGLVALVGGGVSEDAWAPVNPLGLPPALGAAVSLGALAVIGAITIVGLRMRRAGLAWQPLAVTAAWVVGALALANAVWPGLGRPAQGGAALVEALVIAVVLRAGWLRRLPSAALVPLGLAMHLLTVLATVLAWQDSRITVGLGAATVLVAAVVTSTLLRQLRAWYVGLVYAYALVLLATAFDQLGWDRILVICATSTVATLVAIAVTLVRRVPAGYWWAVLAVTAVPFVLGVGTVLVERRFSSAVASLAIFALAVVLTLAVRPGLSIWVRGVGAGLAVPALSVAVVDTVPQLIESSGSPVSLPIVALLVSAAVPLSRLVRSGLITRGLPPAQASAVRLAIELSSLVTAVIAVVLSLWRDAAGLGTALIVLLILGAGGIATALFAARPFGWWAAGASLTGALWCAWGMAGVDVVEPYVYPPALALAVVGAVLVLTGRSRGAARALVLVGLSAAALSTLVLLAWQGNGADAGAGGAVGGGAVSGGAAPAWRAIGLVVGAAVLVAVAALVRPRAAGGPIAQRAALLRVPLLLAAMLAAAGGAVEGVRIAVGADVIAGVDRLVGVIGAAAIAAFIAALAGLQLRVHVRRRPALQRWPLVPSLVLLVAAPIAAAGSGSAAMWLLWVLTMALLVALVGTARRRIARTGTVLPPVPVLFAVAWCTAVAGWSERDLHVEWWSLPLGAALLAAGVLGMRAEHRPGTDPGAGAGAAAGRAHPLDWPAGFTGSWLLLAPGIVVALLPSLLATGTNPATWRAITVIALALAALLIGSLMRLAAPFLLSLGALVLEIAVVFLAQLGRDIDALLWWITLAAAGTVLLVIAIGWERRSSGGLAARIRDLR